MKLPFRATGLTVLSICLFFKGAAFAQLVPLPPVSDPSPRAAMGPEGLPSPTRGFGIQPPPMAESVGLGDVPAGGMLAEGPEIVPPKMAATPAWYSFNFWLGPVPWDTSIELGLNGSEGTNDVFSIRAGGNLDRKTKWHKVDVDMIYNNTSNSGVETQNNAQLDLRHDWLLAESPWTVFAAAGLFYDEYQAFDVRFNTNGGVGYRFIDNDLSTLIGRFGAGTSREFGGPDDRWVPEALFGMELDHSINERQKISGSVDYFPDWGDFTSYRVVADVGWEILISEPSNVSLKLAVTDRYDSTPNGVEPHLLNYSVLMLWKL